MDKRRLVKVAIRSCSSDVVVLQETKKEELSSRLVKWILGLELIKWCVVLAVGTTGGIASCALGSL